MVEKISINIKIPPLNKEHNFMLPLDMSVQNATSLIIKTLLDEYPGVKCMNKLNCRLLQMSSGKVLHQDASFKQLGIPKGDKLLLI